MEMPYNFISIPDKAFNLWKRGLDYTVDNHSFILFILLLFVGFPLCMIITTPILLLAGIEYLLYTIMDYLDERIGHDNPLVHFMTVFGIMIMLVPTLTFVGPSLIWHNIKKHRVKKREERTRLTLEQINNDIQQWYTIKRVEDFKPKHRLKAHTFIEKPISFAAGYHSIAIGSNNTTTGYYSGGGEYFNNNGQPNRIRYE
jgi:predicted PurR-regulated permease PerM